MKWFLGRLYVACAGLACVFLASIAALVILQVFTRMFGFLVPGLIEFATYAMVASVFLGIAHTLRVGGHIRVTLVLHSVQAKPRWLFEVLCFAIATAIMLYFSWYAVDMVKQSWRFGYRDQGMAAVPLWIPQSGMAIGAIVGAMSFCEGLVDALRGQIISDTGGTTDEAHPWEPLGPI